MDERTIKEFGIHGFTLMEVAGTKAADFIMSETFISDAGLFVCGKGNNAGDALVAARILSEKGYAVTILFVSGADDLSADTLKNLNLLKKLNGNISFVEENDDLNFNDFEFIVDGMLGTGLLSNIRSPYDEIIEQINNSDANVFSMDVPSGLNADNGRIMGIAIRSDFTITFGALKAGFYLNDGFEYSGEIILCELPFPNQFKEKAAVLIDDRWVSTIQNQQKERKHKYDGGVVYIIAGSEGLTGAGVLAAKSAWNTGVGAVILITPNGLLEIYEKHLVQIIKKPVGTINDLHFKKEHSQAVLDILNEKPGTLLIGPGLGRKNTTIQFVLNVLSKFEGRSVIDADALFAIAQEENLAKPKNAEWVLTPHPGELAKLLESKTEDDFDRLIQVSNFAKSNTVTLLSKGYPCILGTKNGQAFLTGYNTKVFSRAGFGDILAGKICAKLLQTNSSELACINALLDGKEKSELLNSKNHTLEPVDLI